MSPPPATPNPQLPHPTSPPEVSRVATSARMLQVALWVVVAAVVGQAALAGLFLSGVTGARFAHLIVGWLLPYLAIAVAVVAGVAHARGDCRPAVAIATYPLPFVLWVQEVLGHVPVAATTAVHVPLGVLLAVYSAGLALHASRPAVPGRRPR